MLHKPINIASTMYTESAMLSKITFIVLLTTGSVLNLN